EYSYARDMARRGYVVLSIDQLGAGRSDKPGGDFFSLDDAARALHQVTEQVRAFSPHARHGLHPKIAYVGHSNGSVTSIYAQGTYGDADELVVTGWDHGFRPLPVDPSDPDIQAAISTPYIQFRGPKRDVLMYFLGATDPAMVPFDDAALTDSMPRHQFLDLIGIHADITNRGPGGMTPLTRSEFVKVPVLVLVGDHDDKIAPASAAFEPPGERAFYANSPDFTLQTLHEIGHCVNLHLTHRPAWDAIDTWLSARER
ncbi:MAG TPA: alpha/beta fold hydrolase, partial [Polyangiaceae bacterium]|nr:alpha/beta fold hydrolase [Polyangiaceae bacterium]